MTEAASVEQNTKNRKVIVAIFGMPAFVFLISTGLYFLVANKSLDLGTVNNGELIVPTLQFAQLPLNNLAGEAFDYSKFESKWAFVVFGDRYCAGSCDRMLYIARQSIISLAKKMGRVRLVYVSSDATIEDELQQRFDQEYRGMDILVLPQDELRHMFADSQIDPYQQNTFYVVDQRGWMMMFYQIGDTEQITLAALGNDVVRDMKRLIK